MLHMCNGHGNHSGTQLNSEAARGWVWSVARVGHTLGDTHARPLSIMGGFLPSHPSVDAPLTPFPAGLTSPFSGGSPFPNVLVTTNTSVSCSRDTTSYSSMHRTCGWEDRRPTAWSFSLRLPWQAGHRPWLGP